MKEKEKTREEQRTHFNELEDILPIFLLSIRVIRIRSRVELRMRMRLRLLGMSMSEILM
jgi:hypothetical protein